jgi:glucose/arabinose dehydrogenase
MKVLISILAVAAGPAVLAQGSPSACTANNAGIKVPDGFCVQIVADSVGAARHVTVAPNGDLLIATRNTNTARGGVVVLRDSDGDGVAETRNTFGIGGGTGIAFHGGYVYFATDSAIVRWRWAAGALEPTGPPDTVVSGLLSRRAHAAKPFTIGRDGSLFVNIGAPSNACQLEDRKEGSKGQDPCPLLDQSGGIWRFDSSKLRQTQEDGERWVTGIRNIVAITMDPAGRIPWGVQHGRDLLAGNWGKQHPVFTDKKSAENPGEEMFRLDRRGEFGWPYCYYDLDTKKKVLAPEYGGDGKRQDRCASAGQPQAAYPGHWAPNAMAFYTALVYPVKYRNGAFIAFHGSWNRAPLPQEGFNVVFQPFRNGRPTGAWEVFADGFRGGPNEVLHRPSGLAIARDGSLIVTDDAGGRVYRIRAVRE